MSMKESMGKKLDGHNGAFFPPLSFQEPYAVPATAAPMACVLAPVTAALVLFSTL